jgi:transposase, IS5 family
VPRRDVKLLSATDLVSGPKRPRAADFTNKTVRKGSLGEELERLVNHAKSRTRARAEHMFGVVKRLRKFDKVRYRGLAKSATRAFVTLATANICHLT